MSDSQTVLKLIKAVSARIPSSVTPDTRIEIHPCDWLTLVDALQSAHEPRACTCHPDDNPPRPCRQKYALSECRRAAQPPPCDGPLQKAAAEYAESPSIETANRLGAAVLQQAGSPPGADERQPIPVTEIVLALEREADGYGDARWLAASHLRRMSGWETRTLMCRIDTRPSTYSTATKGGE